MPSLHPAALTNYGWGVCAWALLTAFQYGYHISVLNQIQAVLTCKLSPANPHSSPLPTCFPMSDLVFSFLTAVFTIGGLLGSLVATKVIDRRGRRAAHLLCALLVAAGNLSMGLAPSVSFLLLGRFLIGLGSGIGLCVGPIFLAEIAPVKISGNIGVLLQLGIVFGIMFTQLAGLNLATPALWRCVFGISATLSAFQILSSSLVVESPTWLLANGRPEDHERASRRLWGAVEPPTASEESFLITPTPDPEQDSHSTHESLTVSQIFAAQTLRKPLVIVCFAMLAQQVSGINAVLYYSNDILSKTLPDLGPWISIGITVINVVMTFPPVFLIERTGRRPLLLVSVFGGLVSILAVGYGLNNGASVLASASIVTFVMSFAVGLGPIPFVMIPEVSPPFAVAGMSSIALSLNWIVNFIVGLTFLPLRNLLSGGDQFKEGRIFYLFGLWLFLAFYPVFRVYRG